MNLGTPVHVLAARPVAELQAYEQYTAEHGLPLWRIELQLARICMLIDAQRAAPGTQLKLADYIIRPQQPAPVETTAPDDPPTPAQAQATADALGFNPQNRRKAPQTQPAPSP